ncbi:hypothetical protein QLL95_gp0596 [Cotonvirus japonicus]|uniref:Uncharacterized protein n=1 Tax=Cotonvirus japonicus TaxID=2811091 RepID=A0ABM7NTX8_9VIRU|nr:hypothetical protein QLL95_gp0596 [Cotonvirus japonicus]BCS83527.1 hypothetical protein [Cotonvirus japonicus]
MSDFEENAMDVVYETFGTAGTVMENMNDNILEMLGTESQDFSVEIIQQQQISDARPFTHISVPIKPPVSNIHLVVDGLNLFGRMMTTISDHPDDLGLMDIDRNVLRHQFDSLTEINICFDNMSKFFNESVPFGSNIHIVMKKFGSKKLWRSFKVMFADRFMNADRSTAHHYELIVAKPSARADTEGDDRLAVRLALELETDSNRVFVLSNDNYRSMEQHWHLPSLYKRITNDMPAMGERPIHRIDATDYHLSELDGLNTIKFNFTVDSTIESVRASFSRHCISVY